MPAAVLGLCGGFETVFLAVYLGVALGVSTPVVGVCAGALALLAFLNVGSLVSYKMQLSQEK